MLKKHSYFKKGLVVLVTRLLPHAKMLLVPIRFSLTGRLCSGDFYVLTVK